MEGVVAAVAPLVAKYEALAMGFSWEDTPLTTWHVPAIACASYLAAVAVLYGPAASMSKVLKADKAAGKPRKVTFMTHVFALHNLGVCLLSAVMFVGGAVEVYRRVTGAVTYGKGVGYGSGSELQWEFLFCEDTSMQSKGPIFLWSYIYAISKLPELLDTVYALIRGTIPPSFFLHVFHHAVVLWMVWFWMTTQQSLQFIGLLFNTAVHVVMYFYYFQRAYGVIPWWKNYITTMQIVQFMTSFASLLVGLYLKYTPAGPDTCAGEGAVLFNAGFNLILLQGFVGVLTRNTSSKGGKAKKA